MREALRSSRMTCSRGVSRPVTQRRSRSCTTVTCGRCMSLPLTSSVRHARRTSSRTRSSRCGATRTGTTRGAPPSRPGSWPSPGTASSTSCATERSSSVCSPSNPSISCSPRCRMGCRASPTSSVAASEMRTSCVRWPVYRPSSGARSCWPTSGGLTHVEISAALEEPLGTVKKRLQLGLRKLHRTMGERPLPAPARTSERKEA